MTTITTKALRAPKSTDKATGTFYFRVPYARDAGDGTTTLVEFPSAIKLPSSPATGILPATDFPPGVYEVRREIDGASPDSRIEWTPFVVPATGSNIDLYTLLEQVVDYPMPAVGQAQTAAAAAASSASSASASASAAAATAASLASITAGAPEDFNTFAEVAAGKLSKTEAAASYAPLWQAGEVLTAGARRTLPIARVGTLKANGTTGSTFDATEQAKWSYPRQTYIGTTTGAPTSDIPGATTGDIYVDSAGAEFTIAS